VTDLGLAVSYQWFDKQSNTRKEETTFVDVTFFGRTAEVAGEYLAKGRPVLIEGRLKLDTWDDRETKQKRSKLKIIGETMQMLGSKGGGGAGSGGRAPAAAPRGGEGDPGSFSQDSNDYSNYEEPQGESSSGPPTDEVPF
jgi:single-strand DNA-binding protein